MIIAKIGKFALAHKTFLDPNKVITTHDLEIRQYDDDGYCFSVVFFDMETYTFYNDSKIDGDDFKDIRILVSIGQSILGTEEVNLGARGK